MEQDVENTAEHVLHLVRSRMSAEILLGTAGIQNRSATRIVETFRARFAKACDAGVWKRLSNAVYGTLGLSRSPTPDSRRPASFSH